MCGVPGERSSRCVVIYENSKNERVQMGINPSDSPFNEYMTEDGNGYRDVPKKILIKYLKEMGESDVKNAWLDTVGVPSYSRSSGMAANGGH